jgi:hypothetical protein
MLGIRSNISFVVTYSFPDGWGYEYEKEFARLSKAMSFTSSMRDLGATARITDSSGNLIEV